MFAFIMILLLLLSLPSSSIKIPLISSLPNPQHRYSIHLDTNSSHTYVPTKSPILSLPGLNLSFPMIQHEHSFIKIGLKYPSDFLVAVSQFYGIKQSQIEVGFNPQPELIVSQVNFVEERHLFVNGGMHEFNIVYNYGKGIKIEHQICELIEGDVVFFNEYMILEVLNSMSADNGIKWNKPDSNQITLKGNLYNFPHIAFVRGDMQIQLEILPTYKGDTAVLHLNNETTSNRIGLKTLKGYSKLQVKEQGFILKGSSFNIVLYVFLGLFVAFCLIMTINCREETAYTMNFINNIFKSVFMKDRRARVDLLAAELE